MADIVVSRIQHRRGLRSNLPQPLREGELGFCTDTNQLFIGGDPDSLSPGVQVYTDVANGIPTAQGFLDNQILEITVDGTFTDILLDLFKTEMTTVNANTDLIQWDGLAPGTMYVGFEVADTVATLAIINVPQPGIVGDPYAAPVPGALGYFNDVGFLSSSTVDLASSLSNVLNQIQGTALVTTSLNVEITTPDTDIAVFNLIPNGIFEDTGIEFNINETDSAVIDYSVTMNDGLDQFSQTGKLTITSSLVQQDAALADDSVEIRTFPPGDDINFQAIFSAPNLVKIQYTHSFPVTATLTTTTKRWLSF